MSELKEEIKEIIEQMQGKSSGMSPYIDETDVESLATRIAEYVKETYEKRNDN